MEFDSFQRKVLSHSFAYIKEVMRVNGTICRLLFDTHNEIAMKIASNIKSQLLLCRHAGAVAYIASAFELVCYLMTKSRMNDVLESWMMVSLFFNVFEQ